MYLWSIGQGLDLQSTLRMSADAWAPLSAHDQALRRAAPETRAEELVETFSVPAVSHVCRVLRRRACEHPTDKKKKEKKEKDRSVKGDKSMEAAAMQALI